MIKFSSVKSLSCDYIINIDIYKKNGNGKIFFKKFLDKNILDSINFVYNFFKINVKNVKKKFITSDLFFNIKPNNIKKTGNSIELAIFFGIFSLIFNFNINNNIAFTGYFDSYGNLLPVSCLKKKIIIACNNNIDLIFLPKKNILNKLFLNSLKKKIHILKIENLYELFFLISKNINNNIF